MDERRGPHALLIGGDPPTRSALRFVLEDDGCTVLETTAPGYDELLQHALQGTVFVCIADDQLSELFELLRRVGRTGTHPCVVLVSRDLGLHARRQAFAAGIADVVNFPGNVHDLRARLRAAMGERLDVGPAESPREVVRAGGLRLDMRSRELRDGAGWHVHLTRREAALLRALMQRPGQTVTHEQLLGHVWGLDDDQANNSLAVYVRRVRKKVTRPDTGLAYVQTRRGQGYCFEARRHPRDDDVGDNASRIQVMVVDDDRPTVGMMAEALTQAGYSVVCTAGADAPAMARQARPSVVLLDINMPGMDGITVRRRLRDSPRTSSIPVIALSAGTNLRLRAAEMGADDFLAKPFTIDELLLRVERWVTQPLVAESAPHA